MLIVTFFTQFLKYHISANMEIPKRSIQEICQLNFRGEPEGIDRTYKWCLTESGEILTY